MPLDNLMRRDPVGPPIVPPMADQGSGNPVLDHLDETLGNMHPAAQEALTRAIPQIGAYFVAEPVMFTL